MLNRPDDMLVNGINAYCSIAQVYVAMFRILYQMELDLEEAKILDVGCGEGVWTRFYAETLNRATNITGIDIDGDRLLKAKQLNKSLDYRYQDVLKLKEEKKYDIVTCNVTLMCIKSKKKAMKNIRRAIKDKGFFIYMDTEKEFDMELCKDFKQIGVVQFQIPNCVFQHRMGLFQK